MNTPRQAPRTSVRNETVRTMITTVAALVIIFAVCLLAHHLLSSAFSALNGHLSTGSTR